MNRIIGWRRTLFVLTVTTLLIGELVAVSAWGMTAKGQAPASPLRIAVVGDSYSTGIHNSAVWPTLLAQRTGWSVANFALPDAGFAAEGRGGHAFTNQVDRAQGAYPQIVLIVGGLADTGLPYTKPITIGARDAINKVKLGGERALVIGPTWYSMPVPDSVGRVSQVVERVASEAGVPFLDALDPPWLRPDLMRPDLSAPTDEGQSVIADKVAAWLRNEVGRSEVSQ